MSLKGIAKEFSNAKSLVLKVLEEHPESRNDDLLLYVSCCKELGAKTLDDICIINLSSETIRRARQKIQNEEKLYLPDERVDKSRRKRESGIRDYMRKKCS